jgi:septation ring formation regulator EzrA
MYSDATAQIINDTTNSYWSVFTQKIDHYKFLINFLPKLKFKRINYIKKHKQENTETSNDTCRLHVAYELSKREIDIYKSLLSDLQVDK